MTNDREKDIRNADYSSFTQREWKDVSIELLEVIYNLRAELQKESADSVRSNFKWASEKIKLREKLDIAVVTLQRIYRFPDPQHYIAPQAVWADEALIKIRDAK